MGRGPKRGKDKLPKVSVFLADASARATCLLRFAHHELAAVELFAWALLRFPEAPLGLRLALLQTLQEEQVHCQLYLDRVAEILPGAEETRPCGETPLTPYIWKSLMSVREAEHPLLAFLCGMGLTFEAANLDHSLHFRDLFLQAGDEASAAALQRVHDEEIRHVRLARVWLRRLSRSIPDSEHAQKDDADLYQTFAVFPPFDLAKAKGRPVGAIDARRRAGFSEEYINRVQAAKHQRWPKERCKV